LDEELVVVVVVVVGGGGDGGGETLFKKPKAPSFQNESARLFLKVNIRID